MTSTYVASKVKRKPGINEALSRICCKIQKGVAGQAWEQALWDVGGRARRDPRPGGTGAMVLGGRGRHGPGRAVAVKSRVFCF